MNRLESNIHLNVVSVNGAKNHKLDINRSKTFDTKSLNRHGTKHSAIHHLIKLKRIWKIRSLILYRRL